MSIIRFQKLISLSKTSVLKVKNYKNLAIVGGYRANSSKVESNNKEVDLLENWTKLYKLRELSTQRSTQIKNLTNNNLTASNNVVICGWVERIRKFNDDLIFLIIKDGTGHLQCILKTSKSPELKEGLNDLSLESLVRVEGKLIERPSKEAGESNKLLELDIETLNILSKPKNLPFYSSHTKQLPNEEIRLRHRCLDLRRDQMQHNLRLRSKLNQLLRNHLIEKDFVEVETPILFKATPEGAKEFLVPSRQPDHYYSLPQSPQQYKQLLMVSGIDKYFQLAKCFRDEDLRADRQPEFTQLDIELTYCKVETIIELIEGLVINIWSSILNKSLKPSFPHISYDEAMERFGSDKPDVRYDYEIKNISKEFNIEEKQIRLLKLPQLSSKLSSNQLKAFGEQGKAVDTEAKLRLIRITQENINNWFKLDSILSTSESANVNDKETICSKLNELNGIQVGDVIGIEVKDKDNRHNGGWTSLGRLRIDYVQLGISQGWIERSLEDKFLWIVDFPLFELEEGIYKSTHHPFTSPKAEDLKYLLNEPEKVRGDHYDLVLNGQEIGGGSLRIHDSDLQKFILTHHLKLSPHQLNQFHHLLTNLNYACPPHGGIALGLDRLMSILCDSSSLRDVIAFPKTNLGQDLMVGSPSTLEKQV